MKAYERYAFRRITTGVIMILAIALVVFTASCNSQPSAPAAPTGQAASSGVPTALPVHKEAAPRTATGKTEVGMSLYPAEQVVKSGQMFTVQVLINSNVPVKGSECFLSFTPGVIECTAIKDGTFFKDWSTSHTDPPSKALRMGDPVKIDNGAGRAGGTNAKSGEVGGLAIVLMTQAQDGPIGSGVVYTCHFEAIAPGEARIKLENPHVADVEATPLLAPEAIIEARVKVE